VLSLAQIRLGLKALAIAAVAAIIIVSVVPAEVRPHLVRSGDLEHFAAYLVTGCLVAGAFPALRPWRGIVALALLSAVLEVVQTFVPGRHPGLLHWFASSAGGAAGFAAEALAARMVPAWRKLTRGR
jgi:VanZ family protein